MSLKSHQSEVTIIPVIVSIDKTLLTLFRNKTVYPIYLTIGNIPKHIRQKVSCQAHVLIGYIPMTKLTCIQSKAARQHALGNLFHTCMYTALGPISPYGETSIDIMSGNGVWQQCLPISTIFIDNYPEQALVTCTYNGYCPKCIVASGQLGEYYSFSLCMQSKILDTYLLSDEDSRLFHLACCEGGMKPIYHLF